MARFKYTAQLTEGLLGVFMQMNETDTHTRQFLREALSLRSLGRSAISNLTASHLDQRMNDPEANSHVELIEAKWKVHDNEVVVFFYCSPTYGGQKVLTPSAAPYQGSFYNVVFQFEGVETFLGSIDEFSKKNESDREKAIEDMMWNCPVKVYSNDPSFYYQGNWEDLAKVDGVVFDFPGPTGTGYWHNRHASAGGLANPNIRITKHMAQIVEHLRSFVPTIAKAMKKIE